jgi:hypothetical protein
MMMINDDDDYNDIDDDDNEDEEDPYVGNGDGNYGPLNPFLALHRMLTL